MPRQPRLDAPETLHHVMVRGIERTALFRDDRDRTRFVTRVAALAAQGAWTIYAWALLPNHAHLLVRTGQRPLPRSMRSLLTGYAGAFNRRHKRVGHLFQNRYKSIVVEDDPYLQELVRYIHLNPLRAKLVPDLSRLDRYPWSGHAGLLGRCPRPGRIGRTCWRGSAGPSAPRCRAYRAFLRDGLSQGRRPELVGGGLIRSLGGWAEVRAMRRRAERVRTDPRVLGTGAFVDPVGSRPGPPGAAGGPCAPAHPGPTAGAPRVSPGGDRSRGIADGPPPPPDRGRRSILAVHLVTHRALPRRLARQLGVSTPGIAESARGGRHQVHGVNNVPLDIP